MTSKTAVSPPKVTAVAPVNMDPVMVTALPPPIGPPASSTISIAGMPK